MKGGKNLRSRLGACLGASLVGIRGIFGLEQMRVRESEGNPSVKGGKPLRIQGRRENQEVPWPGGPGATLGIISNCLSCREVF